MDTWSVLTLIAMAIAWIAAGYAWWVNHRD